MKEFILVKHITALVILIPTIKNEKEFLVEDTTVIKLKSYLFELLGNRTYTPKIAMEINMLHPK